MQNRLHSNREIFAVIMCTLSYVYVVVIIVNEILVMIPKKLKNSRN